MYFVAHIVQETLQLRSSEIYKFRDILKAVSGMISPEVPYTFTRCKDPALAENLLKFEHGNRVRNYKFGILYCKEGQVDENHMFANSKLASVCFMGLTFD